MRGETVVERDARLTDPNAAMLARTILALNNGKRAAKAVLNAYGVPVSRERVVATRDEAIEAAMEEVGFPCVLQVDSPDIAGIVRIDLRDKAAVGVAYDAIIATAARISPAPRIDGVSVQEMVPAGLAMTVGMRHDPQRGPLLAVGFGGVLGELAEARLTIEQLKIPLEGFCSNPVALADILLRVSELAHDLQDAIAAIDIDPVILLPDRAVVVGALIIPKTGAL